MSDERPPGKRPHFWAVVGMIAAFFMPWISFGPIDVPGYQVADGLRTIAFAFMKQPADVALTDTVGSPVVLPETPEVKSARLQTYALVAMVFLIPAVALLCVVLTLTGKFNRPLYVLLGVLPFAVLGIGIVHTGVDLFRFLGIGFWFTMAGGIVAILGGFSVFSRPRVQPAGFPVG
jgi:hypothetical protein